MTAIPELVGTMPRWDAAATVPGRARARLHPLSALIAAASPGAMWAAGNEVTIVWDGMQLDLERLRAGLELAAQLASQPDTAAGPYR